MRKSISVIALAGGLALMGCAKSDQTASSIRNGTVNFADDAGDAISNTADHIANAVSPTPTAQEFLDKAAKSDAFEIASAKLAKTKAASADLKAFAAMMIEDHTASTAKIKKAAAAAKPELTPDPALTADQQGKIAKLDALSGADFNKEYATQQVDAHKTALSLMKSYADKGEVVTLKAAAGEIAPKVETHLKKIEAIDDKL
jgi:putative membrane protein